MMKQKLLLAATAAATLMAPLAAPSAHAQDIGGYIGEMRIFPYGGTNSWCPRGWARTDGQLLAISQYSALFSLYGTTWGGDGRTSFGLPDLRGRMVMNDGAGPGLTPRSWGQRVGIEDVTLTVSQLPSHNHSIRATNAAPNSRGLANASWGDFSTVPFNAYVSGGTLNANARTDSMSNTGGSQSHTNIQPVSVLQHCVAISVGMYPSRN